MSEEEFDEYGDIDDDDLIALAELDLPLNNLQPPLKKHKIDHPQNLRQTTLFSRATDASSKEIQPPARRNWPEANNNEPPTHHELDLQAGKTWLYPLNMGKIRAYQFNIVFRGLFHNTLVALPTGLGKTFIAATIMLNWFRWSKSAKIIFVAPTKPLVQQQIHACANITGIPYSQCTVLTGDVHKTARQDEWENKRVFFMTPQTLESDLSSGICDPKKIVLLVVDEAHRATGEYAYVKVVRKIRLTNTSFRILALTATPGADVKAVQQVIDSLHISKVEIRTDESIDLREYVYDRDVDIQLFTKSDDMGVIMDLYSKAATPLMQAVDAQLPSYMKDPLSLTPYGCLQALADWNKSGAARNAHFTVKGKVAVIFTLLGGLAHGMDLLKFHSLTAAWQKWKDFKKNHDPHETNSKSQWKTKLFSDPNFNKMMETLERMHWDPEFIGHPKLDHLKSVILAHLIHHQERANLDVVAIAETRVMVFTTFRDSADVIAKCLEKTSDLIKPHVFVGQADSKNSKGMTQKRQLEVIEKFKNGVYNVLIATSIGEEGLDIGQVDLIICYDSKASPLRMLQRMGRTGRKRAGKVILLQMVGKEQKDWDKAQDSYKVMQKKIADGKEFTFHGINSRRILPREIEPEVDKCIVDIPVENSQLPPGQLPALPKRGKRKVVKKFSMPENVETGFVSAKITIGKTKKGLKNKEPHELESDPIEAIPSLESVILSSKQQAELERNYQMFHCDDESDGQITGPSLNNHPLYQRKRGPTRYVSHSKATERFVLTLERISYINEYSEGALRANLDNNLLEDGSDLDMMFASDEHFEQMPARSTSPVLISSMQPPPKPIVNKRQKQQQNQLKAVSRRTSKLPITSSVMEAEVGEASSPPSSDPLYARPDNGVWLGSHDTLPSSSHAMIDESDSSMDDFIVGDSDVIAEEEAREQMIESSLPSLVNLLDNASYRQEGRFRLSSESNDDDSDGSLPDINDILPNTKAPKKIDKRRRVIDDSDED